MSARTRRHALDACASADEAKSRIKLHKKLCKDLVFGSSALQQIEFKGTHRSCARWPARFSEIISASGKDEGTRATPGGKSPAPLRRARAVRATETESGRARLLCDHLAGMTDAYALRSYKRLFDPDYGSISELI